LFKTFGVSRPPGAYLPSPHWKTRPRRPRKSLPGPSHPPQPSPLRGGAGLSDALPRRGSRRLGGIFPRPSFGRFTSAGPPPTARLPSAIAPAVPPTLVLRVGPNFRAIVGAIFMLLNIGWFTDASGQKSDVLAGSFSSKNTKGNWGRYGLYGTLPEAFLVSGNYRIQRKRNFRFLRFYGNKFSFPPRKRIFVSRKRKFVSGVLYRLALSYYEIFPVPPSH
jgi:hypothetical protein